MRLAGSKVARRAVAHSTTMGTRGRMVNSPGRPALGLGKKTRVAQASASLNMLPAGKEPAMFDQFTPKGRILVAALDCAAAKGWDPGTLLDIAEAAKLPLAYLRNEIGSKTDILAALMRAVDDE